MSTLDRVKEIVSDHLGFLKEEIHEDSNLKEHFDADSLDAVEIMISCEDEFTIKIQNDEIEKVTTVADLVRLIESKQ